MKDIENFIYTKVRTEVLRHYPSCGFSGAYTDSVSSLPCVYCVQTSRTTARDEITTSQIDVAEDIDFEISVYAASKQTAKGIIEVVDAVMQKYRFRRDMSGFVPNEDRGIIRYVNRYSGRVRRTMSQNDSVLFVTPQ